MSTASFSYFLTAAIWCDVVEGWGVVGGVRFQMDNTPDTGPNVIPVCDQSHDQSVILRTLVRVNDGEPF